MERVILKSCLTHSKITCSEFRNCSITLYKCQGFCINTANQGRSQHTAGGCHGTPSMEFKNDDVIYFL